MPLSKILTASPMPMRLPRKIPHKSTITALGILNLGMGGDEAFEFLTRLLHEGWARKGRPEIARKCVHGALHKSYAPNHKRAVAEEKVYLWPR